MFYRPGIYYIKEDTFMEKKYYSLVYHKDKFDTPETLYGDTMSNVVRVWNEYAISKKTTGVLFTGTKGSGKTMMSSLLCNLAIDNGLPVVLCIEIDFTIELVRFLSQLKHAVLFMDEFNKNIHYSIQDKLLTMLSDVNTTNKLIIMTENNPLSINNYIIDRPGRIRYHYDFDKLSKSVFEDYCMRNMDIEGKDKSFYVDLLNRYLDLQKFSFDQLQAIVTEHNHYPDDDLETLFNILNLHGLSKPKKFVIDSVVTMSNNEQLEWSIDTDNMEEQRFKYSRTYDTPIMITLFKKKQGETKEPPMPHYVNNNDGYIGRFRLPPENLRQDMVEPNKYTITIENGTEKYIVSMSLKST